MSASGGGAGFSWQQVDHTLANLMLAQVSEEMGESIRKEEREIRFANRDNQNAVTVPSLCLQMQVRRTDEWAQRTYDAYCDVWRRQGNSLTPQFLRVVCEHGIRTLISMRTEAVIASLEREGRLTRRPGGWHSAASGEFARSMKRLFAKWQQRAEIDAKALEHVQPIVCDNSASAGMAREIEQAKERVRHFESKIAAVDTKIAAFQQSLTTAIVQENPVIKPKGLSKIIDRLHADRKELEFRRDDWMLIADTALRRSEQIVSRDIPLQLRHTLSQLESVQPQTIGDGTVQASNEASGSRELFFDPSEDYRHIVFKGKPYSLSRKQAEIVKFLHQAAKSDHPDVGKDRLLGLIESETSDMRSIFKRHPLWQKLIISRSRGTYRLNLAEDEQVPENTP